MNKIEIPTAPDVEFLGYFYNKKNECLEIYISINGKEQTVIKNL